MHFILHVLSIFLVLRIYILFHYVSSFLVSTFDTYLKKILVIGNFKVSAIKEIIIKMYLRLIEAEHFANDDVDTVKFEDIIDFPPCVSYIIIL